MKTKLIILMMSLCIATTAFAQKPSDKSDKETKRKEMLEFKVDFLSKEIDLREDQKKQFADLYSQMDNERRAIFKRIKAAEKSVSDKKATEAEYEKATSEISEARAEMVQVEKRYDEKFSTFLTKKQMFKLKEAENKFMQKMQGCRDKKKQKKQK